MTAISGEMAASDTSLAVVYRAEGFIAFVRAFLRSPAVPLLQVFAFCMMVFPSDTVLKPIGGGGYVGGIVAYLLLASYLLVVLYGRYNPFARHYPVRGVLSALWLSALASYALMTRTLLSSAQQSSADRWLIQLAGVTGVILVAAEFLRTLSDIHRVLRALMWGAAVCGLVAAVQFWLNFDVTPMLRHILIGFKLNTAVGAIAIGSRSGLNRVAGTATDPIELGVVAAMLLPLALYLAMHDTETSPRYRWIPVVCIAISIPTAVSRAAILGAILVLATMVICLRPAARLTLMAAIPVALAGIFVTAHRLLGTLQEYLFLGSNDNSISHRVGNLPYVMQLVEQHPVFGQGGGTYIATGIINLSQGHILDDQYLDTAIELGVVGLIVLIFFFTWPTIAVFVARLRTADPKLRDLCAALGAAGLAATVDAATFDALSFPMFVMVEALVLGLIGAVWLLIAGDSAEVASTHGS